MYANKIESRFSWLPSYYKSWCKPLGKRDCLFQESQDQLLCEDELHKCNTRRYKKMDRNLHVAYKTYLSKEKKN